MPIHPRYLWNISPMLYNRISSKDSKDKLASHKFQFQSSHITELCSSYYSYHFSTTLQSENTNCIKVFEETLYQSVIYLKIEVWNNWPAVYLWYYSIIAVEQIQISSKNTLICWQLVTSLNNIGRIDGVFTWISTRFYQKFIYWLWQQKMLITAKICENDVNLYLQHH